MGNEMSITIKRGNRITHEWSDVPTDAQVRQALQARIADTHTLFDAMATLESGQDGYPIADECLDNVALTFLSRGKSIEEMSDADFALIGAHVAQWFHKYGLRPIFHAEQATVAQRLDDEAAEREGEAA